MNTASTALQLGLGPEFWKNIINTILKTLDDSKREAIQALWAQLLSFLSIHWGVTILYLIGLLLLSFVIALLGRWGMFGSVAYHYIYFGILFVIGLIFGPDIFTNNYFELLSFAVYICAFRTTGVIINDFGLRGRRSYI